MHPASRLSLQLGPEDRCLRPPLWSGRQGADPRTGEPGFPPVLPACAAVRLVSVRWFSCWVPTCSCLCFGLSSFPGDVPRTDPFLPLAVGVMFQLLEGGTSGQTQGHRPKNRQSLFDRYALYSIFWDFGSLHQKHRVGGTHGRVRRDGSDGWQSPGPRGDNTGGRARVPPPPTIAFLSRRQVPNIVMGRGRCTSWQVLHIQTGAIFYVSFLCCGVNPACCCGSGTRGLRRRCGVLAADGCGSGQLNITDVAAPQSVCGCGTVHRFMSPG